MTGSALRPPFRYAPLRPKGRQEREKTLNLNCPVKRNHLTIRRYMGMEEIGNGIWMMYYRDVFLGYFDEKLINRKEQYLKLANKVV